jgi:hypothetical protein
VSSALNERLGWPYVSFSSYIRAEARRRGLPDERRVLQDLAAGMIDEYGWDRFCQEMLDYSGLDRGQAPFIVEGARHFETVEALRRLLSPVPVLLIYLAVSDEERNQRLAREGVDEETGSQWERHSTEREVLEVLPKAADLVVDADQPLGDLANTVSEFLIGGESVTQRPANGRE